MTFVSEFYGKDAIVIWTDYQDYMPKIFYSRYDGNSWSTPAPIPNQEQTPIIDFYNYTFTRSGISEFGRVKAVWAIDDGNNWSVYYSLWDGNNWSIPTLIGNHRMPEIDCNGYDYSMVVYDNHRVRTDIYSSYEGDNFLPKAIGDTGDSDWRPAVSFLQNGVAIAVFWSESSNQDIYYSRWDGNWSKIQLIYPESNLKGSNWNPEISSDTLIPSMRTHWWKWFPGYPPGRPPDSPPPPPPPVPPDDPVPPPGPPTGTPGPVPADSPPRKPVPNPKPTPTPIPEGSPVPGTSPGSTSIVCHWDYQGQSCIGGCSIGFECTRTPKGTSECACLETGDRDVVVRSVELQEECISGEVCKIIFRVANHGEVKIENLQYTVKISGKEYGPFQYNEIIESGESAYITMNSTFASSGAYNGKFMLDPDNLIDEIDEKNNNIDFTINVSKKSETPLIPPSNIPSEVAINLDTASKLIASSKDLLQGSKSINPGVTPCELIRNEALNYYNQAISYIETGDYTNANNLLIQSISAFESSIECFEDFVK